MLNNINGNRTLSNHNKARQTIDGVSIDQYPEQLHAAYDPVYSMLTNCRCAVMEVETKFNILNNRLSIQGERNPIESIKSRVKEMEARATESARLDEKMLQIRSRISEEA